MHSINPSHVGRGVLVVLRAGTGGEAAAIGRGRGSKGGKDEERAPLFWRRPRSAAPWSAIHT